MKKTKAAALAGTVLLYLFGLAVLIWVLPDRAVSRAERRRLEQRPSFSAGSFLSGAFAKNLETYFLDQFPGRDGWRAVQARLRFDLLRQRDSNGVYRRGDAVSRLEYPLAEKQVTHAAGKINWVMETYLAGSNVRFAVIPDKNYFMAGDAPHLDYGRMFALLDETVAAPRVDLSGCLQLEDYYRTDSHWRQERLLPVAQALADSFDVKEEEITAENISSTVSGEMRRDAVIAVIIATLCMLLYIWFRFKDIRFATSAVVALLHDVLVVLAFYAAARVSVGNTFIACMLTIVGYSINATIVIFDRIREELHYKTRNTDIKELVNKSITQTLTRSIYTSLTTFVMVAVLFVLGVSSIKEFALPLMVGIVCGGYSSVCITGALWYVMKTKFAKK